MGYSSASISLSRFALLMVLIFAFTSEEVKGQLKKCAYRPCKNGGRCVDQPSTFYGYSCVCNGPWKGVNCDQYSGGEHGGVDVNQYLPDLSNQNNLNNNNRPIVGGGFNLNPNNNNNNNQYNNNPLYPNNRDPNRPYNNNQNNQYNPNNPYGSGGSGLYGSQNNNRGSCSMQPCMNGALCQPNGAYSYSCLCRYNYYGQRCESYRNPKGTLLAIILGTILPFFALVIIVAVIAYCFCCNRKRR